jgi:hypothetical protein
VARVGIEVRQIIAPDGRPGVLVQLPDAYVVACNVEGVEALADSLHEAAQELRKRQMAIIPSDRDGL